MRLFEKAKVKNLVQIAENSGFTLRKQGNGYAAKNCPHCAPGSNDAMSIFQKGGIWRWHCFRCDRGGSVIDFAAAVWGLSEKDAAIRLANDMEVDEIVQIRDAGKPSDGAVKNVITSLLKNGQTSVRECLDYLNQRGISERTVTEAVRRGMLRFLPPNPFQANKFLAEKIGIGLLRESGFLKPDSRWPGIAFRPIVSFFPGCCAAEFRIARAPNEGEPKAIRYGKIKWPWWWKQGDSVSVIHVVEGIIDLLSLVELGLKDGEAVIGIPGTTSWSKEWFTAAHAAHPNARFIIGFDADEAGKQAAYGICQLLESMMIDVSERMPAYGGDWNDFLLFSKAK
jgi:DNA primase